MFPVKCKDLLPVDHLVIKSVAVRGRLGPLTVWVSKEDPDLVNNNSHNNNTEHNIRLHPRYWDKVYEQKHSPSRREYKELVFNQHVKMRPGETRVFYVHSTLPGDEAIVYDNSHYGDRNVKRLEDDKLAILSGRAHVSPTPFGQEPIWGWGNAWRDRREFVGRLAYGTVYKLWNPEIPLKFGSKFQDGTRALFMCQRRMGSPWAILPDECLFYILNMCRWDWFDDDQSTMKLRRKREKERARAFEQQAQSEQAAAAAVPMEEDNEAESTADDVKPASVAVCASGCGVRTRAQAVAAAAAAAVDSLEEESTALDDDEEENEDVEMEDNEEEEEEEEEVDSDAWEEDEEDDDDDDSEHAQYHRATRERFSFRVIDSDDEDDGEDEDPDEVLVAAERRNWVHRQVARLSILRALAMDDDV